MESSDYKYEAKSSCCKKSFSTRGQSVKEYLGLRWRRISMSDDDAFTKRRLVSKNGDRNIIQTDIHRRGHSYLADIFVTLVDTRWRFILLMFLSGFILSWLTFALLWWLILFARGDFKRIHDKDWTPCVDEVVDFPTALLFSIETQHTIGYGSRATTSKCPEAIILMMLQSAGGTLMTAILTGIVFSKIQRPKRRSHTVVFSKNAVICIREGKLCLLFRVGDMRREHMIGTHIRAIKVKKGVTKEGEVLPLFEQDVAFHVPPNGVLFLVWPATACHIIDSNSPFYNISRDDLNRDKFELIVIMEGTIESTGMTTQVRTSYLPSEILWGHRFRRLTMYQKDTGQYQIRYNNFHSSVAVDTPTCSAREMEEHPDRAVNSTDYWQSDNEDTIPAQHFNLSSRPPIPSFTRGVSFEEQTNSDNDSTSINESSELIRQNDAFETADESTCNVSASEEVTDCPTTNRAINTPSQTKGENDLDTKRVIERSDSNRPKVFTIEKSKIDTDGSVASKVGIIKLNANTMGNGGSSNILEKQQGRGVRKSSVNLDTPNPPSSREIMDINLNNVAKITEKNTLKNTDLTG